jgi:hypothetical protein
MGWSMGWDAKDDGRTLPPIRKSEYFHQYDDYANEIPDSEYLPSYAREAFLFRGKELIPETLRYVHGETFTPTKWESRYSTLSRTAKEEQKFTPVIDDNYRIVGHLGWVGGHDIFVPQKTIGELSPFRTVFEEARLAEWHRQRVWSHDHPIKFGAQPATGTKPPVPCWPGNRSNGASLKPILSEADRKSFLDGPGKDGSEEQRLRENINFLVAGGGTAIVGEQWEALPHQPMPKLERYLLGPGTSSPGYSPMAQTFATFAKPSPYYRFLTLVGPDGLIQAVFRVQEFHPESREDKILRVALEVIDIAIMIWTVIDIVTIPIALARITGELVAREALIQALRAHESLEVKAVLDLTLRESAERALRVGAMSGPEEAAARTAWEKLREAFWRAGDAPPKKVLGMTKQQVEEWNVKIAKRMKELGIPENNIGAKVTKYDPNTGKFIGHAYTEGETGEAFVPSGGNRGRRLRTYVDKYEHEEGGIAVHGNVFDDWEGFDLWNQSSVDDRIDAIIAHEWSEFSELTHWETVELAPDTQLAIRQRARELLKEMAKYGNSEKAFAEFATNEWTAIKAAKKTTAAFDEKMAAAATAKK